MRNGALFAVIAVMVCLVAPIATGFMWPVESDTETAWETNGSPLDLTNELATEDIPGVVSTSLPSNNLYLFETDSAWMTNLATPHTTTDNDTTYPVYEEFIVSLGFVEYSGELSFTSSDFRTLFNKVSAELYAQYGLSNLGYIAINQRGGVNPQTISTADGVSLYTVNYYPNGTTIGVVEGATLADRYNQITLTDQTVNIDLTGTNDLMVTPYLRPEADGKPLFADPKYGFLASGNDKYWSNGYTNHRVDIMIKVPDASNTVNGIEYTFVPTYGDNVKVAITTDNDIRMKVHGETDWATVGNLEAYKYVLLRIDADMKTYQLYGIIGVENFTTPTSSNLGNMVEFPSTYLRDSFKYVIFRTSPLATELNYFVSSALAETYTFKGISDATVNPYSYFADGLWMLKIANPAVFGSSLTFTGGMLIENYPITNGTVRLPIMDEQTNTVNYKTVAVRDMRIVHVMDHSEHKTFINGERYGGDNTLGRITFNGGWVTNVTLYDVNTYSKSFYVWEGGGFGLDTVGFCAVGIISAVSCFLIFGLLYRKDGEMGTIVGMLVSVVCGVLYMLIALQ